MTTRRETVRRALNEYTAFRSAQDLYADLRAGGSKIGLTTVYRALQSLSEAGEIDVLRNDDGEAVYRLCHTDRHHHHLVCRGCGRTVEVEGPAVEAWADAIGREYDFVDMTHTVEIFGTCPACASNTAEGAQSGTSSPTRAAADR